MVYSKRVVIFAVKITQNDKKTGRVSASFPLSASHLLPSCQILA